MSENAMPLPYEVQEMTTTEARKHLPDLVNMAAYGHVTTVLTRDGRRLARIVPEEDAWVYSPAWQEKLQEAEADLAAGRVPVERLVSERVSLDDAVMLLSLPRTVGVDPADGAEIEAVGGVTSRMVEALDVAMVCPPFTADRSSPSLATDVIQNSRTLSHTDSIKIKNCV